MRSKVYIHYGCGHSAPNEWLNFDVSPTLRIQKTPIIGTLLKRKLNTKFPPNVRYGDIISGLPVEDNSCDGVYCSHTLEHLSLQDFRTALRNTYKMLRPGGIFRCVVPDLEYSAREYIKALDRGDALASIDFIETKIRLGLINRPKGLTGFITSFWGNSHHLWMWDAQSLSEELRNAGFREIRTCNFNDCEDKMFQYVEDKSRFEDALAIECKK